MTADASWAVHPLSGSDLPELLLLDAAAFNIDPPRDFLDEIALPGLEPDRVTGVHDPASADLLVGAAAILSKGMTFPGCRVHPVAAVTWVSVRAGWRRRGLLTAMMRDQLHGLHETGGEAVAILTASEGVIYGRYGYGRAVDRAQLRLPHGASFAPTLTTEPVREITAERASQVARELWARVAPSVPGHLTRTDTDWLPRFANHEFLRRGTSAKRWAAHADGYVGFRVRPGWADRDGNWTVVVQDLCAATPVAHASLWRFVLDLDLTDRVTYDLGWVDDPVQDLLLDRRSLTLTRQDHVWVRIVDLDRAIGLRGYSAAATLDVEIIDDFCRWNADRWHLELHPDGGRATRTDATAQVRMHIRDLAACFVGGTPLGRLVAGGLVTGAPDAVRSLEAALATPVGPWCPEGF